MEIRRLPIRQEDVDRLRELLKIHELSVEALEEGALADAELEVSRKLQRLIKLVC